MNNINPIETDINKSILIDNSLYLNTFKERIDSSLNKIFGKKNKKNIIN